MTIELPTREQLLDTSGRPLTQSLFLETIYSPFAVYTLKDIDSEYNGRMYPSIKRLYLEMADPTEYQFATTYLLGVKHWMRICENKLMKTHVEEWRFELELKLRSEGVKSLIQAAGKGSLQASKWLADRGWDTRGAGRPTKEEVEREKKIQASISDEYEEDARRLMAVK